MDGADRVDGSTRRRRGRVTTVLAAAAWTAMLACDEGSLAPTELSLPRQLVLVGEAQGTATDGRSIDCYLDIVLELGEESERTSSRASYTGTHGGHVGRTLLDPSGNGFAFDAFVGGQVRVSILAPDRLEVVFPANENVESRFWAGLFTLDGTFETSPEDAEGSWSCEPLDLTEGYVDTTGVVVGRWQLRVP